MKIVITSATPYETKQIKEVIENNYKESNDFIVSFHTSGVGILPSTFSLLKLVTEQKPDFVIQAGIAGCFDNNIAIGTVFAIKDEFIGDMGVEENGIFKDIFDLNLGDKNEFPFTNKALHNNFCNKYNITNLEEATGVTVNEVTTKASRIKELQAKYNAVIESMEGAPLHYVCLQTQTPFIQVRSVSNYIGERDKTRWNIPLALNNLTTAVVSYVDALFDTHKHS